MIIPQQQPDTYEVFVRPTYEQHSGKGQLIIMVNGEETVGDAFEFVAPIGVGIAVRKVTRIELVP